MSDDHIAGPLWDAAQEFPQTAQWNDSADMDELRQSIAMGGVGATCNPVIAYTTINQHKDIWGPRIRRIADDNPTWGESDIGWQAIKDMSVEAAGLLLPAFEKYNGVNGRLSVQTDPRLHRSAEQLVAQAVEFSELAPNIIVKAPATKVGIEAIEEATYRGVCMNVTVSFTVPQALVAGEAIERGLRRREAEGLRVDDMGPVVTIMAGRLDDWLKVVVEREQRFLDPGHLEWAGIAAVKRAYRIFQERGLRSRLLVAAYRNVLQWSEFVGGDLVLSPPFKWAQRVNESGYKPVSRIDAPVADDVMETLLAIPEFVRAYEPDGMTIDEFDHFGATLRTMRQFLGADADLDALVREVLVPAP
ncbi:MAG: transaldolase [Propionibacterium sp.]|nr:transaldolase [Propionibacterium sp.]